MSSQERTNPDRVGAAARWTALQQIWDHEELVQVSGSSAFLRWDIPAQLPSPALRLGSALALPRHTQVRRNGLLVMGPPPDVDRLLATMVAEDLLPEPLGRVAVQRGSLDAVARHLPLADGNDWEWLCATEVPARVAAEDRVVRLEVADEPVIRELLAAGNPRTDARPFEHPDQHWAGVRGDDGSLLACGVREHNAAGYPHLSGITVHPSARGTGLGVAVTARLTREGVEESGVCTLGMYSDNAVARRVYTGLGYGEVHLWSSRRLAR